MNRPKRALRIRLRFRHFAQISLGVQNFGILHPQLRLKRLSLIQESGAFSLQSQATGALIFALASLLNQALDCTRKKSAVNFDFKRLRIGAPW
jgi:hypothetical protein